jgi:hypothetical protein
MGLTKLVHKLCQREKKGFNSFVWNVRKKILNLIIEATFLAYKKPCDETRGAKKSNGYL